jgi:lysophospholipase L1-like esterase
VSVLVVSQPTRVDSKREWHQAQQRALEGRIASEFAADKNLCYVNLATAIDLSDRALAWDGMHLTPTGNQIIAQALTKPVLELMHDAR